MIRFSLVANVALFLSLTPFAHATRGAEPQVIDGIAAVVNGDVITYSQVRSLVGPRERALRAQFKGEELEKQLKAARDAALKDLIDRQLIIQHFKKEGFSIPDQLVEERVDEIIRESFGGNRQAFMKMLQSQNISLTEFKQMEYEKIIVQAMRSKNAKLTPVVSPTKVEAYYRQHRAEFTSKEQVKLRLIMIPSHAEQGNAAAQKALAEEILGKLAAGAAFDRMAQMYSEDSTRDSGGDWGWIERKTLAPQLERVAFNLPTGKISNIIELGGNYYILKVEEHRGGETPSLAKLRPEIEKRIMEEEARHQTELWLATLREKAYIRTF